jgi:hypothetical protein
MFTVDVVQSLVFFCSVLKNIVVPFALFLLAIVLSVRPRFTASGYPFGIFKHFL